ncbi:MAG: hypothetical protein CSA15_04890 [Candidatus Delongbacteria bacterium]|nr:MAG: hypothetical protein CSA15_04890 [Candidatus Delongbacteria bacterium]
MADKKIYVASISQEILLRRNARIRRLSIKISGSSGIVLCVPFFLTDTQALQFLVANTNWIQKQLAKEKYTPKPFPKTLRILTGTVFFQEIEHNVCEIEKDVDQIYIKIPKHWDFENKEQCKRKLLEKVLKGEAQDFLSKRVAFLANKHGFEYGKLSFRNQKTRWGSCSYKNNISLNIQLMRLPLHLVDYVIIHELCHTVHKNHSKQFWQLVYSILGENMYKCKIDLRKISLLL